MTGFIALALRYKRTVLMLTMLIVVAGFSTLFSIPKESSPDVSVPTIYVSVGYRGLAPKDSDSLLIKPLTKKLESIEGIKELRTVASEGHASVILEFDSGTNMEQALVDTREQVRQAKADLPNEADEPRVNEINVALFPILTVSLAGNVSERTLTRIAKDVKDKISALQGVLEVDLIGKRKEIVEVVIQPQHIEAYNLAIDAVAQQIAANNLAVTSGSITTGNANFPLKVNGLIEQVDQLNQLPIANRDGQIITLGDVALIRRTYEDPSTLSRVQGKPTIQLQVVKRIGGNIIAIVEEIQRIVDAEQTQWPDGIEVSYFQDESINIQDSLQSLLNNVISASLLVILVIILVLGITNALMVGLAIPAIFLATVLLLSLFGFTLNMVVLFALVMCVGMIVDGSIVVTEFADKRMLEGVPRAEAYAQAGKRMAKPIFGSTITTLAVFGPLLFWPDLIGDFMQYIPITVIIALTVSLLANTLVIPSIGALIGTPGTSSASSIQIQQFTNHNLHLSKISGFTGLYVRMMNRVLAYPLLAIVCVLLLSVGIVFAYASIGKGVVFFPESEPERAQLDIRGRGNMSIFQKNSLVLQVERLALAYKEIEVVASTVYKSTTGANNASIDTIGQIYLELADWKLRSPSEPLLADILERANAIPGIIVQVKEEQMGPPSKADLVIEFIGDEAQKLDTALQTLREHIERNGSFTSITDTRPLQGLDFAVTIDREQAARFGANVATIGRMVKLLTNGEKIGDIIPPDSDEKIDIMLRFPPAERTLNATDNLRIQTNTGLVPLSQFMTFSPKQRQGTIERVNSKLYYQLLADVKPYIDKPTTIAGIIESLSSLSVPEGVTWRLRGEQEDQQKAAQFLSQAFGVAFFILLVILVSQFNSFFHAGVILSSIIFSIAGVFLGLMVRGEPFGIVMSGVGIIALSGIVVNNNIILIDFYIYLRSKGLGVKHAILSVCADRLRPVILTSFTTSVGLLPLVLQLNLNFIDQSIDINSPRSQIWVQLATAISGGLAFATILTLVMTPCLLYVKDIMRERRLATKKTQKLTTAT